MDNVSRRGLLGLICGVGGAAVVSIKPSAVKAEPVVQKAITPTASTKSLEELRRTPMDDDAEVFETFGRFERFNLEDRYGFLREVGSDRRILIHVSCLSACGIKMVSTDTIYRFEVLRRPKGWQAFRIFNDIKSRAA